MLIIRCCTFVDQYLIDQLHSWRRWSGDQYPLSGRAADIDLATAQL